MSKTINIAIYAVLLFVIATLAYAPNETKEKSPTEVQLMTIEKKIDDLLKWKDATTKQLDEIKSHLDKIERLIRTRN